MSNTTYTGRVYDCYGEILEETEGYSVEEVEQDILDKWTGCVEAKGYAVLNDDGMEEEAIADFPFVRQWWNHFSDY